MKATLIFGIISVMAVVSAGLPVNAQDLSPAKWPKAERLRLEQLEYQGFMPPKASVVTSRGGIISATVSPIAVYAGLQALKQGGNAADAADVVALTQITRELGSVVSYAGIYTGLYYDAATHKVSSIDAGYNSYLGERDPATIPEADLGPLNKFMGIKPTAGGAKGRQTLVPGFMAGVGAMQKRFGKLPFKELFEPAIWYAEHGVKVSPELYRYFDMRQKFLARTPEGQAFLAQAGGTSPQLGAMFRQPELAKTLQGVAEHGASYMYTGPWAQAFVKSVQRYGGKVTAEDLSRYQVTWSDPSRFSVFGHTVYANGEPSQGPYELAPALNLAEALGLQSDGPYWQDPKTFRDLTLINDVVEAAPALTPQIQAFLRKHGVDASVERQMTKAYAKQVASLLPELVGSPRKVKPGHSNAIVVVDKAGDIAVITHTINAVVWGDTGIVVDGVPVPDSGGFQQQALAAIKPGSRLPSMIIDTIAFKNKEPVLATASIGSSLAPESIRTLFGVLGQHQDLKTIMGAPPLLANFTTNSTASAAGPGAVPSALVPQGGYTAQFLDKLRATGLVVAEMPAKTVAGLRGTVAAVSIDPDTGERRAVEYPDVMIFDGAQ